MDISSLVELKKNPKIPDILPGDTVRVSARIVEGGKERIQVFQGVIIKVRKGGAGAAFTVRHVASGIGVERTFPFHSPLVEKVEVVRQGKVRRARLYYLRRLSGKEARRKIKRVIRKTRDVAEEVLIEEPEEAVVPVIGEEQAAAEADEIAEEAIAEAPAEAEAVAPEAEAEVKEEAAAEVREEAVAEAAPEEPKAEEAPEEKAEG